MIEVSQIPTTMLRVSNNDDSLVFSIASQELVLRLPGLLKIYLCVKVVMSGGVTSITSFSSTTYLAFLLTSFHRLFLFKGGRDRLSDVPDLWLVCLLLHFVSHVFPHLIP